MNPKYPIYIPSKGRWNYSFTSKRLWAMGIQHAVVVEEAEYDQYAKALGDHNLLKLPFSNLGQGSIPARNWIWEHSLAAGYERHWILDDNIRSFYRLNFNRRIPSRSASIFRAAEYFTDRYENIAISGFNYAMFANERDQLPPFYLNTRIYSMILIKNDLPYRWRGRLNEDTDLSLRALKDGWCTVLFNAFLGQKLSTQITPGGNTDTVYKTDDHRLGFVRSLQEQHPDVVKLTWKFGRWHHQVNYEPFKKNKLKLKAGITPTKTENEFGMVLRRKSSPITPVIVDAQIEEQQPVISHEEQETLGQQILFRG